MLVEKIKDKHLITISKDEALVLINSLTAQIINDSSDIGRDESYTDKGEYFTIFVLPKHFRNTVEYTEWLDI